MHECQSIIDQLKLQTDPHQRVELCLRALALVERAHDPASWAWLQVNLANNLILDPSGGRADNLERAIEHYGLALQVYTREAFPEHWARAQGSLGNLYSNRIRGERADNLEKAIACYGLVLEVYTREAFPELWATAQGNLGTDYRERIHSLSKYL
jgi:hypothetical protein